MSPGVAVGAGLGGLLVIGGAAFVVLNMQGPAKAVSQPQVKLVEMIGMKYPMGQTAEAVDAPAAGAVTITRVRQGSDVQVMGVVEGDAYYQIELPDHRLAYVPVGAIPEAATPPAAPAAAAAPPAPAAQAAIQPAPAPAPAAIQPAPAPAAQPVPAVATAAPPVPEPGDEGPPVVTFADANDVMRVINASAVYLKPDRQAPTAYPVDPGTPVYVIARSTDGNWAWVETADNAEAYMPMSDLGP
jgi:hypothetical protein